jgi:hypothetical protein
MIGCTQGGGRREKGEGGITKDPANKKNVYKNTIKVKIGDPPGNFV